MLSRRRYDYILTMLGLGTTQSYSDRDKSWLMYTKEIKTYHGHHSERLNCLLPHMTMLK